MVKEIQNIIEHPELLKTVGRYTITGLIGKGTTGVVYRGMDPYIKRPVAIKVFLPEKTLSEKQIQSYREQFFTDVQTAGRLMHPNIIAIYDAGLEENLCYVAMEFVEGKTLLSFCAQRKLLPFDKVMNIITQVGEALDCAHQQGVLHRDIKPANIMITQKGIVKLTDFGLTRLTPPNSSPKDRAASARAYQAPETLQAKPATLKSDLFSLGVTLYELLTGEQPFKGETPAEVIKNVIHYEPAAVHEVNAKVPEKVSRVVMRALAKDPARRHPGVMEFLFALKTAWQEAALKAEGTSLDERVNYIKALKFFKGFTNNDLAEILKIGTWFHYKKDTTIIKENERGDHFYIVIVGQVRVERRGTVIALIERGSCFGEMAALARQKRTASVVATEDCVVIKIDANTINRLSQDLQIRFYKRFLYTLISRLEATSEKLRH